MTRKTINIEDAVHDFFCTWEEPWLEPEEIDRHTYEFMNTHYDPLRMTKDYGYNFDEALKFQLQEYCREVFDWTDEREGNE